MDATIPGGLYDTVTKIGWKVNASGTSFRYLNKTGTIAGITGVTVRKTRTPGQVKFTVRGKNGAYPVVAGQLPLVATLVLDPPLAEGGQCTETAFAAASCKLNRTGSSVTCK
jgi:hypothetical protein